MARCTFDLQFPSNQPRPLAHARQAQAWPLGFVSEIETRASVRHLQFQATVQPLQRYFRSFRAGVKLNIAQRFLRDAKEAKRRVGQNSNRDFAQLHGDSSGLLQ